MRIASENYLQRSHFFTLVDDPEAVVDMTKVVSPSATRIVLDIHAITHITDEE